MRNGPPDDPTLIGMPKLASTENHTKAIHDDRQIISLSVFLTSCVGYELTEAVNTALSAVDRKFLGICRESDENRRGAARQECNSKHQGHTPTAWESRGEEARSGGRHCRPDSNSKRSRELARASILENVDSPQSVVGDVEERVGITAYDRRLRARIADKIDAGGKID